MSVTRLSLAAVQLRETGVRCWRSAERDTVVMAEKIATANESTARVTPAPAPTRRTPVPFRRWSRVALLILLATVITGAVPVGVSGNLLGLWHLALQPAPPAPTAVVDYALPRAAWVTTPSSIVASPGDSQPIAVLDPGYPVTLSAHRTLRGMVWSFVTWQGPDSSTGGGGWMLDTHLVAYGSSTAAVGDFGALSPALEQPVMALGARFAGILYFPDSGELYAQNPDQQFSPGDAFRLILTVDLFAQAATQQQPAPDASSTSVAAGVAAGAGINPASAYEQLGDAAGLRQFLASTGASGIAPAPHVWTAARATPSAILAFLHAFQAGMIIAPAERDTVLGLLTSANAPARTALADLTPLGEVALVPGVGQTGNGWTASIMGVVQPVHAAPFLMVLAIRQQATQAAAQHVLGELLLRLVPLLDTP